MMMTRPSQMESTSPVRPADLPVYDAEELTQNGSLAHIALNGQLYTLRITRQGKLILTK